MIDSKSPKTAMEEAKASSHTKKAGEEEEEKDRKPSTLSTGKTETTISEPENPRRSAGESHSKGNELKPESTEESKKSRSGDTTEKKTSAQERKHKSFRPGKKKLSEKGKGRVDKAENNAAEKTSKRKQTSAPAKPTIKLLINAEEPEECRVAQLEDGKVESFYVTTVNREQTKNNIYKGRISAIEPNLQAAFVDIGLQKNGFLPFAEIHPEYFSVTSSKKIHWKDHNIEEVVQKGQEVFVQIVKEAAGSKGANITTYLSIPGRFLVLMPGSDSAGISRKIDDESQRLRLRTIMSSFSIPEGVGYIIRTASQEITKSALSKDLKYLLRLWMEIKKRGQTISAPALIYKDQDIIPKFLRDHFSPDIKEILLDSQQAYDQVMDFLKLLPVKQKKTKVKLHDGQQPIFNYFNVEAQIENIYQPVVKLPSGGSIVINPTEALVAIDVNSGRTSKDKDFNETIFLANMEAATELARQLRLRDLGGLIVVDFIDMRPARHIREVEKQVKASMKRDKAKVDISRISKFGLMQISRQKMGAPIQLGSYKVCDHCQGRGIVRSVETQALLYLRRIQTGVASKRVKNVNCRLPMSVAQYLLNKKREDLLELEKQYEVEIKVEPVPEMSPEENQIDFIK